MGTIAMTFEEFTAWWARSPEVDYIVLNSSPFEAVTTLLNYISVGTCRTQHLDTFIVATVQCSWMQGASLNEHPVVTSTFSIVATAQSTCRST